MAIAVNEDGYRETLSTAEGMKKDKAVWEISFSGSVDVVLDSV